jgi:hypothetical protein
VFVGCVHGNDKVGWLLLDPIQADPAAVAVAFAAGGALVTVAVRETTRRDVNAVVALCMVDAIFLCAV